MAVDYVRALVSFVVFSTVVVHAVAPARVSQIGPAAERLQHAHAPLPHHQQHTPPNTNNNTTTLPLRQKPHAANTLPSELNPIHPLSPLAGGAAREEDPPHEEGNAIRHSLLHAGVGGLLCGFPPVGFLCLEEEGEVLRQTWTYPSLTERVAAVDPSGERERERETITLSHSSESSY